jgi:site-specific DNA-methyltransferase (adenine-specific)
VGAVITDAPYSERTHRGHDIGCGRKPGDPGFDGIRRRTIAYDAWGDTNVASFVSFVEPICDGWFCALTDHVLARSFDHYLGLAGRYVFPPVPCVSPGSRVRLAGDGPSSWTVWLVVARPSRVPFSRWGTLPGAYVFPPERAMAVAGGKPLHLMRAIIRDYTRPGDLVCDPCAGGGTTLLAAAIEGRRAIGAEMDEETFKKAKARLDAGYTPNMFATTPAPTGTQGDLL